MERWESIYFDILSRLQKVCDGLGISMWLSGRAALGAYRDGRLTGSDVSVLVNAKDAMRLAEALAECSDETFRSESMLSNSRYPRFEIRVFDPRTTDCDTSEFFRIKNNCMHVTVLFLQRDVNEKSFANKAVNKLFKKTLGSASQFRRLSSMSAGRGGTLKAGGCRFRSELFEKKQPVCLYDREFFIPADTNGFFEQQFGPGWKYLELKEFVSDDKHFRSTERGWSDWRSQISNDEIASYADLLGKYRREHAKLNADNKRIQRIYDITDQSVDKIRFYKEYVHREAELSEMLASGETDRLEEELKPYLRSFKKFHDLGLDLFIDEKLTEITDALLRCKGETSFADGIKKLIPAERQPVSLTDHHGKPIEYLPKAEQAETDDGKYRHLSPAQRRLLELMKRVDAFLQERRIEYFLFGGSLLGAIRHDGFIPWDDDMDIVMTRDNYYKLVALSDDLPWDDIAFDCFEKNPKFQRPFGMFTLLTDTRFVKTRIFNGGAGMGTGIDVFVMDNVPFDDLDEYLKNSLLYQEIQTDSFINNARIKDHKDEYFECKEHEAAAGKTAETVRLRDELEKYGEEKPDDLRAVRLWFSKPRIYEPGMMADPVMHKFEDTEFPVPAKAEECLRMQYGSDWNVVPEDGDRGVHAFKIDFDISANNYYRLIDEHADWEKLDEILSRRKNVRIALLDKSQKLDEFRKRLASGAKV